MRLTCAAIALLCAKDVYAAQLLLCSFADGKAPDITGPPFSGGRASAGSRVAADTRPASDIRHSLLRASPDLPNMLSSLATAVAFVEPSCDGRLLLKPLLYAHWQTGADNPGRRLPRHQ